MAEWVSSSRLSATTKRVWRYTRPAAVLIMHELKSVVKGEKRSYGFTERKRKKDNEVKWAIVVKQPNGSCLGSEVSMEESLGVKVSHSLGRVAGDFHPQIPRDLLVAQNQLFQAATLDVLSVRDGEREINQKTTRKSNPAKRQQSNKSEGDWERERKRKWRNGRCRIFTFTLRMAGVRIVTGAAIVTFQTSKLQPPKRHQRLRRKMKKEQKEKETRSRTTSQTER